MATRKYEFYSCQSPELLLKEIQEELETNHCTTEKDFLYDWKGIVILGRHHRVTITIEELDNFFTPDE